MNYEVKEGDESIFQSGHLIAGSKLIKDTLSQIKEEFEDHLVAINQNTGEIRCTLEYVSQVDSKIDKLNERIDKIQLFLEGNLGFIAEKEQKFTVSKLSRKEQEFFLTLYAMTEHNELIPFKELARKACLHEDAAKDCLSCLTHKGIPIIRTLVRDSIHLRLDKEFRRQQTKHNILGIEQRTIRELF